jgi:rod shape-determining protein MreC
VALGQPVIDDVGVVGQVTRIFPFTSEVTLLTDKDQAIPVQVVRSGLRSVAYGQGQSGILDLRFMAANADIRNGDVLVTSGIDGVYPPGLAVAKVVQVENKSSDAFAHIQCQPSAGIDRNRQLLILLANTDIEARPESEEDRDKKDKFGKKRSREMFRDTGKDAAGAPAAATGLPVTAPAAAPAGLPAAAGAVAPDVLKEPVRPAAPIIKDVLRAPPEPVKEAPKPAVAPAAGPVTSRAPAPPPAATLQKATTP